MKRYTLLRTLSPFALSRYGGLAGVLLGFPGSSGERRREDTPPYQ